MSYLTALLASDSAIIFAHEEAARCLGYGPLVPCQFMASPSEQRSLCCECVRNY